MDLAQLISLLTALGVGTAFGNYVGAGRARREVRSAVLKAIGATETQRWAPVDYRMYRTAYLDLETAALVAQVPRRAVHHYLVFAEAALEMSSDSWTRHDGEEREGAGNIDSLLADLMSDCVELVIQLAWRPWQTRVMLSRQLKRLRNLAQLLGEEDPDIARALSRGQQVHGALPGSLGKSREVRLHGLKSLHLSSRRSAFYRDVR